MSHPAGVDINDRSSGADLRGPLHGGQDAVMVNSCGIS